MRMKLLSEVVELVGTSRRTLQEYDKIGLLHPSGKTEQGYWLYSDSDIMTLITIRLFLRAGYKRKEIAELLSRPAHETKRILETALLKLELEGRRINGLIVFFTVMNGLQDIPHDLYDSLSSLKLPALKAGDNYSDTYDRIIDDMSGNERDNENRLAFPVVTSLYVVGAAENCAPDSPQLGEVLELAARQFAAACSGDGSEPDADCLAEAKGFLRELLECIPEDPECAELREDIAKLEESTPFRYERLLAAARHHLPALEEDSGKYCRFPGVTWYCDRCGAVLNEQESFDDWQEIHKCEKCGYKSCICEENIGTNFRGVQ